MRKTQKFLSMKVNLKLNTIRFKSFNNKIKRFQSGFKKKIINLAKSMKIKKVKLKNLKKKNTLKMEKI